MKRFAYFGVILLLLAAVAVPALAKTPGNNPGNSGNPGSAFTQDTPQGTQQQEQNQVQDQNRSQRSEHAQNNNHNQIKESNVVGNGNQGQSSRMRTPFYLQGTITAIDPPTQTITVSLTHGNAPVKASIGMTMTLQATGSTQFYKIVQGNDAGETPGSGIAPAASADNEEQETGNRGSIMFDQLAVNDIVAIHGNLVDGIYQMTLLTVYVPMSMGNPMGIEP
jgi:hypothetical protein